jgi:hypothetical protein
MAFRPLKSFFPTADELLQQDLPTLGGVLLTHLKSYEGLNTVYQHAGLHRGYFRAMLENRNVGLGPLPKEPEYGTRQPEVTNRMMEAWNWLERQGLLIHNDQQVADWFTISSDAEEYLDQEKPPAPPSPNPARVSKSATGAPRAFLSYSWDDREHQQWVTEFAERLQGESGVEIIFDRWHLNPGDDKLKFMEQAVVDSNFVIVVCTPMYTERANKRQGGVGYESMVITAELAEHILTNRFIPVLRKGTWTSSLPVYLKSRMGVNLSDEPYHENEYERLLRVLHGEPIQPPPLGSKPDFSRKPDSKVEPSAVSDSTGPQPDVSSKTGSLLGPPNKRPNAIAWASYDKVGVSAPRESVYVRHWNIDGNMQYSFETTRGEEYLGTKDQVIDLFFSFHRLLLKEGYTRMNFTPGPDPDFSVLA